MVNKINGRLFFVLAAPKSEYQKKIGLNFKLSLLSIIIGIFLLPNLAYLSTFTPEEIIALTNQEREIAGLNSLTANQLLTQAAILKGKAILESQIFQHTINDKKFSSWIRNTGYNYSYVGENLAIDFVSSQDILEAWKNSFLHKKNLLSPDFREIGVSVMDGNFQGQDTTIVVQIFGAPIVDSVQPLSSESKISSINEDINFSKTDLADYQLSREENLLPNLILNQELLPAYDNELILKTKNSLGVILNKFIIQPEFYTAVTNYLIIFTSLILIYLILFFYNNYFIRINKLTSI